jgi:hypothetical protein
MTLQKVNAFEAQKAAECQRLTEAKKAHQTALDALDAANMQDDTKARKVARDSIDAANTIMQDATLQIESAERNLQTARCDSIPEIVAQADAELAEIRRETVDAVYSLGDACEIIAPLAEAVWGIKKNHEKVLATMRGKCAEFGNPKPGIPMENARFIADMATVRKVIDLKIPARFRPSKKTLFVDGFTDPYLEAEDDEQRAAAVREMEEGMLL